MIEAIRIKTITGKHGSRAGTYPVEGYKIHKFHYPATLFFSVTGNTFLSSIDSISR